MESYLHIPSDIMVNILSWLPGKSLLRFNCVCKLWFNSINSRTFIKTHHNRAIQRNQYLYLLLVDHQTSKFLLGKPKTLSDEENYDEARIVLKTVYYPFKYGDYHTILGCCNGVLCLKGSTHDKIRLWNLCTREFKDISTPSATFEAMYGLGYNLTIDDFKVVQINCSQHAGYVYRLRTDSWTRIELRWNEGLDWLPRVGRPIGLLVNGALHWLCSVEETFILAFDLIEDEFKEVPLPDFLCVPLMDPLMDLVTVEGCLCILSHYNNVNVEAWAMRQYGVTDSWTRLFTISQPACINKSWCLTSLCLPKIGEVLYFSYPDKQLILDAEDDDQVGKIDVWKNKLVLYDWKHEKPKILKFPGFQKDFKLEVSYVDSLVSLRSDTYTEQRSR